MKINKIVWVIIFGAISFGNLYSQEENSLDQNKIRQNAIRLEMLNHPSYIFLYYQRNIQPNLNNPIIISIGVSIYDYWIPHILDLSVFKYYRYNKNLKPIIGLGLTSIFNPFPFPSSKQERDEIRRNNQTTMYFRPPYAFFGNIMAGLNININKRIDFQLIWATKLTYGYTDFLPRLNEVSNFRVGFDVVKLNLGFKF